MNLNEYLKDEYIEDGSREVLESLNQNEFDVVVKASGILHGGNREPGIDNEVAKTSESLADFADSWASQKGFNDVTIDGFAARIYKAAQIRNGCPRVDFLVIDFGVFRVVLQ